MSPGSIVCVDYGWSTTNLYDIKERLEGKDIRLEGLDDFIHNDHQEKFWGYKYRHGKWLIMIHR